MVEQATSRLAHNVYFTLNDASPAAQQHLVDERATFQSFQQVDHSLRHDHFSVEVVSVPAPHVNEILRQRIRLLNSHFFLC